MASDDEIGEDEEEILVYVEFEGLAGDNVFNNAQLQLDMIGVDTDHPVMQINGRFYEGTYEDAVGTYMFFTRNVNPVVEDPVFDTAPALKYFAKTRKLLRMQRVFVKHRTEVLGDSEHDRCIPNVETILEAGIPPKYQVEALSFWRTTRQTRIDALQSYLDKQRVREEKKSQGITLDSESDEDNPFAAYKQKEEDQTIKRAESPIPEIENDESGESNEAMIVNAIEHAMHTENPADPGQLSSKNLQSDSKMSKTVKSSKITFTASYKKKGKAIQDTRKRGGKVKEKLRNSFSDSADNTENISDCEKARLKSEDMQGLTSDTPKNDNDNKEEGQIVLMQQFSQDNRAIKQLKREAKMKEISDHLKLIAEEYVNVKPE